MSLDPLESVRGPDPTVRPPEAPAQGIYLDRGPTLPAGYERPRMVALVRDPRMIHVYWRLAETAPAPVLRVHDLGADTSREIILVEGTRGAYVEVAPGGRYAAEIGVKEADGAFRGILRSNEVQTPPAGPSAAVDPQWHVSVEEFGRMLAFLEAGGPHPYDRGRATP